MLQLTNHMCDKIAWSLTKLMSISVPHAIFSHMLPCYNAIASYHFKYHVIMPRAISSLAEFFYTHTRTIGFQNYILPLFNLCVFCHFPFPFDSVRFRSCGLLEGVNGTDISTKFIANQFIEIQKL